ncbi:D-alanyl-D-alanine carboxypeptidase family protein [Lacrimispora amygdalina]|uniref:D-alanyl-D-alanine carboxypeptidase family protein n=1 Tax=Lacrimispora amygdalina TaxID=253257 RepID=UPI000BE432D9|nr:D-alanyl-D-alanine carboxypeptidase family protein [Lacrimispora amygdalina]
MKRRIKVLLSCILICQLFLMTVYAKPDWPSDTGIQAEAGIVIDADSGTVIFGQNIHAAYPPASITKILTALIVLENSNLSDMVTFSKDSVYNVEEGSGNKLNVTNGDTLSVEDCLYSLILHSCNQAANALAEHVAGSREEFVRMMNDKLTELGCTESHFDNPSGLNGDTQYVTAYDMALIARAAYNNKKLVEISSAISHKIPPTANNPEGLTIYNEHRLVKTTDESSQFYYPAAVAGKTGYLIKAGNTLVTYAQKDGRRMISVILKGSPRQYFVDGKDLLEFGFSQFENLPVAGNDTEYTTGDKPVSIGTKSYQPSDLELEPDTVITVPKGAQFSQVDKELVTDLPADSPKGAVALIRYTYNDRVVGQTYLLLKAQEESQSETSVSETSKEHEEETKAEADASSQKGIGVIGTVGITAGVLLLAAGTALLAMKKRKENREIAARREERRRRLQKEGDAADFERILNERRNKKKKNK